MLVRVHKMSTGAPIRIESRTDETYTVENVPSYLVDDNIARATCDSAVLDPVTAIDTQIDIVDGEVVVTIP